jgi:branched-chain amino acid transport system ATP-binding protein
MSGNGKGGLALEAEGLHTFYGKSHILHGVGLEVREGEIVTLLGRNGAGKSTTLRSLMGLTHAREGAVRIFGRATTDWQPYRIAALGVGYVPEGRRIFANLSVEENLRVPLERPGPWTIARTYELFPRLAQRKTNKDGSFPAANRKCCRSRGPCCSIRSCYCSTSRRRAWRR